MGLHAKVKAATRHARAVAVAHRLPGREAPPDAADMARMVPPETAVGLGRYRTVRRVVARALAIERLTGDTVLVTRADWRSSAK